MTEFLRDALAGGCVTVGVAKLEVMARLFGCAPKRPLDYSGSAGLLWAIKLRVRAITGNRGSFQRHGNWDSFGVARGHAMKLPRRRFLHLAAGAAALPAVSRMARAQAYPTRPVRFVVGFAPAAAAILPRA